MENNPAPGVQVDQCLCSQARNHGLTGDVCDEVRQQKSVALKERQHVPPDRDGRPIIEDHPVGDVRAAGEHAQTAGTRSGDGEAGDAVGQ